MPCSFASSHLPVLSLVRNRSLSVPHGCTKALLSTAPRKALSCARAFHVPSVSPLFFLVLISSSLCCRVSSLRLSHFLTHCLCLCRVFLFCHPLHRFPVRFSSRSLSFSRNRFPCLSSTQFSIAFSLSLCLSRSHLPPFSVVSLRPFSCFFSSLFFFFSTSISRHDVSVNLCRAFSPFFSHFLLIFLLPPSLPVSFFVSQHFAPTVQCHNFKLT